MELIFARTQDYTHIRSILTHPRVFNHISDDGSPKIADYQPPQHETISYILAHDSQELLGLFMFHPTISSSCLEVHTCLLPTVGRARAQQVVRELALWIWPRIAQRVILTHVPAYNKPAAALARAAGFKAWGRLPRAFRKFHRDHDLILMGLSRPETVCP